MQILLVLMADREPRLPGHVFLKELVWLIWGHRLVDELIPVLFRHHVDSLLDRFLPLLLESLLHVPLGAR